MMYLYLNKKMEANMVYLREKKKKESSRGYLNSYAGAKGEMHSKIPNNT